MSLAHSVGLTNAEECHEPPGESQEATQAAAAVARLGHALMSSLDEPALLGRLRRITTEILDCAASDTFLRDAASDTYAVAADCSDATDQREALRALRIPRPDLATFLARIDREEVVQTLVDELPGQLAARVLPQNAGTVGMYIALRHGKELMGFHRAVHRKRRTHFSPLQVRIAEHIGQLASMALTNARVVEEMRRVIRLKSDFVATVSHELRTPLNAILGYTDLLIDGIYGAIPARSIEILQRVAASGTQLLELINATLDLSRLDAGRLKVTRTRVQLSAFLQDLAQETRDLPTAAAVSLLWSLPEDLPEIEADPPKLKMIVKNLIANALKFTDHGSVTVSAIPEAGGVEIRVTDTGIGIAPDILPIIFEPFRQADSSAARRYAGVGLGLYIVHRLVALLGGTARVESVVNQGSSFSVWLPLQRADVE